MYNLVHIKSIKTNINTEFASQYMATNDVLEKMYFYFILFIKFDHSLFLAKLISCIVKIRIGRECFVQRTTGSQICKINLFLENGLIIFLSNLYLVLVSSIKISSLPAVSFIYHSRRTFFCLSPQL